MAIGTSDTVAAHGNHRVSIDVGVPPEFAFALWSQFDHFPRYFRHIQEVTVDARDPRIQHWKGSVMGLEQEWDAEVTAFVPNQVIAWRSIRGFDNSGSLTFERTTPADTEGPAGTTLITAQIGYDPPMGAFGDLVEAVWVKQRFDEGMEEDLSRFKALAESMYGQVFARVQNGESPVEATNAVLHSEAGITQERLLDKRIDTNDYNMAHIPQANIMTTQELKNRLEWGEVALTIVDVRPVEAYKQGHIQGSSTAPLEVLEERILGLTGQMSAQKDRQIVVYSDREGLSALAAQKLRDLGYSVVFDYVDGFSAWRTTGLPVETQSTGQIIAKGLPEREGYINDVIANPTVNTDASVGYNEALRGPEPASSPGVPTPEHSPGPEPSTAKDGPEAKTPTTVDESAHMSAKGQPTIDYSKGRKENSLEAGQGVVSEHKNADGTVSEPEDATVEAHGKGDR